MPALTDARRERYAQNLASGMGQADAYEAAGFRRNEGQASRVRKEPQVAARVAELLKPAAEAVQSAAFDAVRMLKDAAKAGLLAAAAQAEGDYRGLVAGAVDAIKLAEVLSGGVSDRTARETTVTHDISAEIAEQFAAPADKAGSHPVVRPASH